MRKLFNKPWFVAVMAVAALAMVAQVVFSHGRKFGLALSGAADPAADEAIVNEAGQKTPFVAVKNFQIPGPLRDPFALRAKPETEEKLAQPDLVDTVHLSAIWTQNGQTLVVINDHICENGDEVGRLKIESATQDGVWLTHWKGRDFVSIGGNFTLNTPASRFSRAGTPL